MSKISRTKAVELMKNCKGKFFSVTFIKNDGTERTLNGKVSPKKMMDSLGYVIFHSSKEGMKSVNPKTLKSLKIEKIVYTIKK